MVWREIHASEFHASLARLWSAIGTSAWTTAGAVVEQHQAKPAVSRKIRNATVQMTYAFHHIVAVIQRPLCGRRAEHREYARRRPTAQ